ncbi:MAG: outer membrane beta-barrel protein [Beijerinckiaceae bacterium]|nr:outer membrane beta-barrel protein [Beijerinckiaceae bacterium]
MLRRLLLASTGTLAFTGAALAADLPPPPPPPPPPPLWTGFYIGINLGGTWSDGNTVNTAAIPGACNPAFPGCAAAPNYSFTSAVLSTFAAPARTGGFIGGGQVGYNYQFSPRIVAGVEADIQGVADGNGGSTINSILGNPNFIGFPIFQTASVSKSLDYLGTVRGRLGYLITPTILLYVDGGFAYGGVGSSTRIAQAVVNDPTLPFTYISAGSFSSTRVGWTAGGGGEWLFLPNWSVKVEYLYYDLGSVTGALSPLINIGGPGSAAPGSIFSSAFAQSSTRFRGNIIRAGINYHFNWFAPAPVVAAY